MSILRSALAEHDTDVVLFYANRDHESTIFASAIDELTARHPARLTVNHWLETERGLPTADAVSGVLTDAVGTGEAFICGPAPFMDLVEHTLRAHGIHHDRVHVERYVSLTGDPFTLDAPVHEGSGASEITVTIDGDVRTIRCGTDTVLLDALLAADVDAPVLVSRRGLRVVCGTPDRRRSRPRQRDCTGTRGHRRRLSADLSGDPDERPHRDRVRLNNSQT